MRNPLLLRVYGECSDGQWSLISLDFDLAAQAEKLEDAKALLDSQIREYLKDAMTGQDREFGTELLSRRAPAIYWVKYGLVAAAGKLHHGLRRYRALRPAIPLVPVGA